MSTPALFHPSARSTAVPQPVWRLGWLTPARCWLILIALLGFGFVSHLHYLQNHCPIDLSGDEAQYWDWSRDLELSYYSKGPLIAYIIRASCAVFGDVMWAVRLPALVLGVGTSLLTYLLTLKLFRSDRLALGAVLLFHIVPMFIAGSVLMTIDAPFFFCWALATYLAAHAIFEDRRWMWPIIGVVVGVGFLAKYAMLLWLVVSIMPAMLADATGRRQLRSAWFWVGVLVALLFTTPVIVWNAQHEWVSYRHVATQMGADGGAIFDPLNILGFLGGQIAVLGPPLFVILAAAVIYAWRTGNVAHPDELSRRLRFLVLMGVPFFVLVTLTALLAKVQLNWAAPAYFTLMILAAWFLATRLHESGMWKPWRGWFYSAVAFGLVMMPVIHHFEILYPAINWIDNNIARRMGADLPIRQADPMVKLRGWQELGAHVSDELQNLDPGAFVLCQDYQYTGEMGFYVQGQPRAYCAGSYFIHKPKRASQYDMWPQRSLDLAVNPDLEGRDAVYVGWFRTDLWRAFEYVEELPKLDIVRRGIVARQFRIYRCHNFRGMKSNVQAY